MERQWVFPRLLAARADDFSVDKVNFNTHKGKAGTGRRALAQVLHPEALIYTLEVSFFGYKPSVVGAEGGDESKHVPYTQERYREVGDAVGRAMADYLAPD